MIRSNSRAPLLLSAFTLLFVLAPISAFSSDEEGTRGGFADTKLTEGNDRYLDGKIEQHQLTFNVEGDYDFAYRKCLDVIEGLKRDFDGLSDQGSCKDGNDRKGHRVIQGSVTITKKTPNVKNKDLNLKKYRD